MAENVGTIEATLRLKDLFSPGMKKAAKNAEAAGKRLGEVSKRATGIGKSLSLGVTLPLVGAAAAALKFSTDLNAGMANVASLIPDSTDRILDLKKSVRELAIETGQSTDDMADGLYNVISALGDTADTEKILEINARAAAAGLATVTDAINLTSGVTKGYGDTTADATQKVSDLAFTTVKLGQTTFPELAAALGRVIPLAAKLNLSQEELFATFAALTGVTGKTSMVSTQYAAVLTGLLKPTVDMAKAVEHLGYSGSESMLKTLGFKDTLDALIGTTDGSAESVGKLFGSQEALVAIFALTGAQADVYEDKLSQLKQVVGATDEAFNEQTEGINAAGFAWKQLKLQLTIVSQEIGDELQPTFNQIVTAIKDDIVPAVREWVTWFNGLSIETKKSYVALAALITVLPVIILMLGQIGSAVSGVIALGAAFGKTTASIKLSALAAKLFSASFMGIPIIGWAVAIIALSVAIYKNWDALTGWITKLKDAGKGWELLVAVLSGNWAKVVQLKKGIKEVKEELEQSLPAIEDSQKALSEAGLTGTVEELHAAMANLSGVAGGLADNEMKLIAERAIELRDNGEELTTALSNVADQFIREQEEAVRLSKKLKDTEDKQRELARTTKLAEEVTAKYREEVEDLVGELVGTGLIRQVGQLEDAYKKLTPEEKKNALVMREVSKRAVELRQNGQLLVGTLKDIADAAEATSRDMKQLHDAVKMAEEIHAIMDASTSADMPKRVYQLQMAWTNLSEAQRQNTRTLRFYRDAVAAAEQAGGVFEGTLGDLSTTVLDVEDSTEALRKKVDALKNSMGPQQLQLEAEALTVGLAEMGIEGTLTAHAMEELGKKALALRNKGVVLEGNLNDLADAAENAKEEAKDLGDQWGDTLGDLADAFDKLANIAGGTFGGIAKSVGTVIGSMQVAKKSSEGMQQGMSKLKSGDMLGGISDLATGVMGVVGALDAATASGSKAQRVLGGIAAGAQAGAQFGPIGAGIGAAVGGIVGWIRSNGVDAVEKEGRALVTAFSDTVAASLTQVQLAEAGGVKWKQTVIGVRDAYLAAGHSAAEAEEQVARLWAAEKEGPEAVQEVIDSIQGVIDAGEAIKQLTDDTVDGLKGLVEQGKQTGEIMPSHLEPYLATLRELGLLTEEDENLLNQMADGAHIDWKAMKSSADKYGIALSELGPAFNRKQLEDAAKSIAADWEILNQEGVNTKEVLEKMSGSVQDLMDDAFEAGVRIPESMKPVIDSMVEQGLLVDENGDKLTDMSQLEFAKPLEEKFVQLLTKIDDLITKLTGPLIESVKEVGDSVRDDIPNDITVDIGYEVQEFPSINVPQGIRVPIGYDVQEDQGGYSGRHGTGGQYVDFGQGTLAMLHGREAVVPESRDGSYPNLTGGKSEEALLKEVSGLRREIQNLPIHLRDAILLTR